MHEIIREAARLSLWGRGWLLKPQSFPSEKIADRGRNLRGVGLQRKMAGVEEAHDRSRDVALECLGAGRQEERIVLAPHRQEGRLVVAEIGLEGRVARH